MREICEVELYEIAPWGVSTGRFYMVQPDAQPKQGATLNILHALVPESLK